MIDVAIKTEVHVETGWAMKIAYAVSFSTEWEPGARQCRRTVVYEIDDLQVRYGEKYEEIAWDQRTLPSADAAQVERLREALKQFGEHGDECPITIKMTSYPHPTLPCTCGLGALIDGVPERPEDAEFEKALSEGSVPIEPLQVYDSNSFRRVGTAEGRYKEIVYAYKQSDGFPDIAGTPTLRALVAAFNAMLARRKVER